MFNSPNPDFYLGSGLNLTVTEPSSNPCYNYFIHLKVKLNGDTVASLTVSEVANCNPHYQCEGSPIDLRPEINMPEINSLIDINRYYLKKEIYKNNNKSIIVFNTMGQIISKEKFITNDFIEGIYFVAVFKGDELVSTNKIYINNKNN